jgi:hypothetical protein
MLHDAVNGKHMIDIPCLWPPAFSTAWHCAHLVLKIFSPDLAFPLGASPNDAMVQVKKTTCTYITFRNAVSLTLKISRRYCKDFLAYVDWQSLWLILPKLYKILLTKQASKQPSLYSPFSLFPFFLYFPPRTLLLLLGSPGAAPSSTGESPAVLVTPCVIKGIWCLWGAQLHSEYFLCMNVCCRPKTWPHNPWSDVKPPQAVGLKFWY